MKEPDIYLMFIVKFSYNGVSRSATIVIAYLMSDHAMPLDAAILLTRKARNSIYPNPGFKT